MRLDELFYNWASNNANLTALVGDNIDPLRSAQTALSPRLTYRVVNSNREITTSGLDSVFEDELEIEVFSTSYTDIRLVVDVLQKEFHGLQDGNIQGVFLEDTDEFYNDKNKTYEASLDFTVFYCP